MRSIRYAPHITALLAATLLSSAAALAAGTMPSQEQGSVKSGVKFDAQATPGQLAAARGAATVPIWVDDILIFAKKKPTAARRLYQQSFEDSLRPPELEWWLYGPVRSTPTRLNQAQVTSQPKDGQKSLRGNFNTAITDPISGLPGQSFTMSFNFKDVPALKDWYATAPNVYVSWWLKIDKCFYKGTGNANTDPLSVLGKLAYLRMNGRPETSYYLSMRGGIDGIGVLSANQDAWMNLWAEWYPTRPHSLWLSNQRSYGADSQWHKIAVLIGKREDGNKYLQWFVDDHVMKKETFEPDGRNRIFQDFILDGIQFWHMSDGGINQSTPIAGGYCNGWQLDNIEVWDGLPP